MVTALLQIPTRGFRAEKDAKEKGKDRKKGRTKLKPPSDPPNVLQRQIGAKPEEDPEGDPHLQAHHEATSNRSGGVFGGKDGDRGRLGSHTDPKQQTTDEELFSGLTETGADDREETEDGAEDGTATPEVKVEWVGKPTAAAEKTSTKESLRDKLGETYHKTAAT